MVSTHLSTWLRWISADQPADGRHALLVQPGLRQITQKNPRMQVMCQLAELDIRKITEDRSVSTCPTP